MPQKMGFMDFVKSAFHLRPRIPGLGHFPVNYLGLATFGMLGIAVSPAFLFFGAAAELLYLMSLASNNRFQNVVTGQDLLKARLSWQERKRDLLAKLDPGDCARYVALEGRCRTIVENSSPAVSDAGSVGALRLEDFDQLLWIFLRLLLAREMLRSESLNADRKDIREQVHKIEEKLKTAGLDEQLKKTYESTKGLLERRLSILETSDSRVQFIEAEMDRVEQQVALIGQEAATALRDPNALSQRIDAITTGMGDTGKLIKDLQVPLSEAQEALEGPPSFLEFERSKSQQEKTAG